jgi:hypothetical protein
MGQGPFTAGGGYGQSSQSSKGTQTTNSTPTFDARGNSLISSLQNYVPSDVNSATQQAIASQNAKTNAELGGLLAGIKSSGYGKATNWGEGNMASAAASALAGRDVANSALQAQAAQQGVQNQFSQNQNLLSLLSMLRGESGRTEQQSKGSGNTFNSKFGLGSV